MLLAKADMHTHCSKSTTPVGTTWTFFQQKEKKVIDIYSGEKICGHSRPNTIELVSKDQLPDPDLEKMTIKITGDNTCSADAQGQTLSGTWDVYFE